MSDLPFDECAALAQEQYRAGNTIFQKFTCAGCGARQTMEHPNQFYTSGTCEECKQVTDIRAIGCGFMVIASGEAGIEKVLERISLGTKKS